MTQEYMNGYKGSIQAVRIHKDGKTMRLFANTLTNKAHQQDDYRYLTNSIYADICWIKTGRWPKRERRQR